MKKYSECESFKHKFAKELLHKWLTEGGFDDIQIHKIRDGDGVFMEYPLCAKWPNGFNNDFYKNLNFCPSYEDCIKNGDHPTKVADIAVIHEGTIKQIFEIYHTHRIEKNKINRLSEIWPDMKIYEISADRILNLTTKPSTIIDLCESLKGNCRTKRKKYISRNKSYMHSEEYELANDSAQKYKSLF